MAAGRPVVRGASVLRRRLGADPGRAARRAGPLAPARAPSRLARSRSTGVGPKLAEAAAEAGIATVGDLLLRLPHSHRDRTVVPGRRARARRGGDGRGRGRSATARARSAARGLTITSVKVGDESGSLARHLVQPAVACADKLTPGTRLLLTGSRDKRGLRVSEYEILPAVRMRPDETRRGPLTRRTRGRDSCPVHPATEQLKPQRIRQWVGAGDRAWPPNVIEPLPAELRARRGLAGGRRRDQRRALPRGRGRTSSGAGERLAFEELFLLPGDAGDAQAHAPSGAAGAAPGQARGAGRAAGSSRCPSSRPATSCAPSTRSTPTSTPASRCSGC